MFQKIRKSPDEETTTEKAIHIPSATMTGIRSLIRASPPEKQFEMESQDDAHSDGTWVTHETTTDVEGNVSCERILFIDFWFLPSVD